MSCTTGGRALAASWVRALYQVPKSWLSVWQFFGEIASHTICENANVAEESGPCKAFLVLQIIYSFSCPPALQAFRHLRAHIQMKLDSSACWLLKKHLQAVLCCLPRASAPESPMEMEWQLFSGPLVSHRYVCFLADEISGPIHTSYVMPVRYK